VPVTTGKNKLGAMGFANEYPSQADLNRFMSDFYTAAAGATYTVVQVDTTRTTPSEQVNANIQYAAAMVDPTLLVFYCAGHLVGDPLFKFLDDLLY
jgi:hypothetical protein